MSVCLGYQAVYLDRETHTSRTRLHILALILLFVSLSYKVWLKLEVVELGYLIAESRKEAVLLDRERQELELQYSVLTRPDLLEKYAVERLGLFPPRAERVLRIVEKG